MGKWDDVKSPKILDAMRVALSDDHHFSHNEVVDVVRAALDDGVLTPTKLNDLWIIARNSDTMPLRSIMMLWYLVEQTLKVAGKAGSFSLTTSQEQTAADVICFFLKRMGNGFFPHLNRDRVGIDLLMRVGNPGSCIRTERDSVARSPLSTASPRTRLKHMCGSRSSFTRKAWRESESSSSSQATAAETILPRTP